MIIDGLSHSLRVRRLELGLQQNGFLLMKMQLYYPQGGNIWKGNEVLKGTTTKAKSGEPLEIHLKFQPKLKKLTISLVSSMILN